MFGKSNQQKYNDYLNWFADNVKDQSNWGWMRADKDCQNYNDKDSKPVPYEFGEAMFLLGDPKAMAKAIEKYQVRTRAKIEESYKYVGGNKENGLINPEYVRNNEARIATNKELAKSYGLTPTDAQMKETIEKHKPAEPTEADHWVPMSQWEAFKHFMSGKKVQSTPEATPDWRSTLPKEKK